MLRKLKRILLHECVGKGLTIKSVTVGRQWKEFHYINAFKTICLYRSTENAFKIGIYWKLFYYKNSLERVLQLEVNGNINAFERI